MVFATQNATVHHSIVDLSPMKVVVSHHALQTSMDTWLMLGESRIGTMAYPYSVCPEVFLWHFGLLTVHWFTALKARGRAHCMYVQV